MAKRKLKPAAAIQLTIQFLQSVRAMTDDAKTISYINMAIARQMKLANAQ